MASSPVTSEDLPLLSEQTDLCTRMSALIRVYDTFREFLDWLLDDAGNLSNDVLEGFSDRMTPVGAIVMFATHTPPSDRWLVCQGQAVNRTTYSTLFSRLGTTYGAGDGTTTFNLPDLRDRFPVGYGSSYAMGATGGSTAVSLTETNLPNHYHGIGKTSSSNDVTLMTRNWSQASNGTEAGWFVPGDAGDLGDNSAFTSGNVATTKNITAGDSTMATAHENRPPYISLQFMIKAL